MVEVVFWVLLFLVFYTYAGYGLLIFLLIKFKRLGNKPEQAAAQPADQYLPAVTFLVAAWNEADFIEAKIKNCLSFDYPADKLNLFFVTDGSDDGTPARVRDFPFPEGVQWKLFHDAERRGKKAAVDRVMPFVTSPIVIFSDANTEINTAAIRQIVRHYPDPQVGGVAGEKRVAIQKHDSATAGEGFYWKYESILKKLDSDFYTVVGAAGELFSVRTKLYESVPPDTIVEDFHLTMRLVERGFRVAYEPQAYAVETSSATVDDEMKRKVRIAAGGLQSIGRLSGLLNFFRHGKASFQYLSHRVFRWTVAPVALPLLFALNYCLALQGGVFYQITFGMQVGFYLLAGLGWFLESQRLKIKAFFIPYYFCLMNVAMYLGALRLLKGNQSVLWEKAKRK